MIDHVTYQVHTRHLRDDRMGQFWAVLGFQEFQAPEAYQAQFMKGRYEARWFTDGSECDVHLVAVEQLVPEEWGLAHLCVKVDDDQYAVCKHSSFCVRDSGSGRVWLTGPGGIRVEVQSYGS